MITCLHWYAPPLVHDGSSHIDHRLTLVNILWFLLDDEHAKAICPYIEHRWARPINHQGSDADSSQADADPVPAAVYAFVQTIHFSRVENSRVCWIDRQSGYMGGLDGVKVAFHTFDIEAGIGCMPALAAVSALVYTILHRRYIKRGGHRWVNHQRANLDVGVQTSIR